LYIAVILEVFEHCMSETAHKIMVFYILINIALIFSLALPAAGMVNHLLPSGIPSIERGLLLWLLFSIAVFSLTLGVLPLIRKHLQHRISSGKQGSDH
jgi:hypothetical protein